MFKRLAYFHREDVLLYPGSLMEDVLYAREGEMEPVNSPQDLCSPTYLAPVFARMVVRCFRPPGLSSTVTLNLISLPSAARPLSMHLPRMVVSMFPPHRGITTLQEVPINHTNTGSIVHYLVVSHNTLYKEP